MLEIVCAGDENDDDDDVAAVVVDYSCVFERERRREIVVLHILPNAIFEWMYMLGLQCMHECVDWLDIGVKLCLMWSMWGMQCMPSPQNQILLPSISLCFKLRFNTLLPIQTFHSLSLSHLCKMM